MDIQDIKLRFNIIGNSSLLNRAIDIARQVAPTDMTVLISGESGTGKESFPKIIHNLSSRKHGTYTAVNCGAIPEGTIDSELFGHEKGSFTGAHEARKGYFEVANNGTIFLDEVAELPLSTQVRLLRVLESGEFFKVGSSKAIKTDARVIAATNVDVLEAIRSGKFREDLYYRLNSVPIFIPPLRDRKEDILLLFLKFSTDFADKYRMPPIQINQEAQQILVNYKWPGNVRQLKNITEQISIIENNRIITGDIIVKYIPQNQPSDLPVLFRPTNSDSKISERELLYKILFDMRKDINDLKDFMSDMIQQQQIHKDIIDNKTTILKKFSDNTDIILKANEDVINDDNKIESLPLYNNSEIIQQESLSLLDSEKDLIIKALEKYKGKRRYAAKELGISERTLYRKIKDLNLE